MSRRWQLTDVQLIDLWDNMFAERLPAPLFALWRGENAQEWARLRAEARATRVDADDGALPDALTRIAHADVVVSAQAIDPRRPDRPEGRIRVLGGRQGSVAALIQQLPGESIWHSSGFVVTVGAAGRLAGAVVGALPECDAGRVAETPLVTAPDGAEADHTYLRSRVRDSDFDGHRRSADWLASPVERLGLVEISMGSSIFGPRGITRYRIDWRDLVGDGRYAVLDGTWPIAVAVDRPRLTELIAARIATVSQTLEDEHRA